MARNFSGFDPSSQGGYKGFGANEGNRTSAQFRNSAKNPMSSSSSSSASSKSGRNAGVELSKAEKAKINEGGFFSRLGHELKLELDDYPETY